MPIQIKNNREHQIDKTRKRKSPQYILIKTLRIQNKERILKATRVKTEVTFKGKSIRITTDFSVETFKDRRPGAVSSKPSETKMTNLGCYTQQNYLP